MTVESVSVENPKTKDFIALIHGLSGTESVLIVSQEFTENTFLAARNVQWAHLVRSADVNAEDLLRYKKVILTNTALADIAKRINS